MILEYHRPTTLADALALLSRLEPRSVPLAGGTAIRAREPGPVAVVDLQSLGLARIHPRGQHLDIGAMTTLQALLDDPAVPSSLKPVILHEASYNLRQSATIAGTLVAAGGRSPFAAALLALDTQLLLQPGDRTISLGELYALRREHLQHSLIVQVRIPLNAALAYDYSARSPKDLPIVCAAAACWPAGRTRLVLGGFGDFPLLAMDGPEPGGAEEAARSAFASAGDEWASAEYRQEIAAVLAHRVVIAAGVEPAHE